MNMLLLRPFGRCLSFLILRLQLRRYSYYFYYNVMMTKNTNFNSSTDYVYYAVVMTKNIQQLIPALRLLHLDHDKKT